MKKPIWKTKRPASLGKPNHLIKNLKPIKQQEGQQVKSLVKKIALLRIYISLKS